MLLQFSMNFSRIIIFVSGFLVFFLSVARYLSLFSLIHPSWWSEWTTLEKQASFASDNGFYVSFFRHDLSIQQYLSFLLFSPSIEAGSAVVPTPLQRFNILPEVVMTFLWKFSRWTCPAFLLRGVADPIDFYVYGSAAAFGFTALGVWCCSLSLLSLILHYEASIRGACLGRRSVLGFSLACGVLASVQFLRCAPVLCRSWTAVAAREGFAVPALLLHFAAVLSHHLTASAVFALIALLCWQMSAYFLAVEVTFIGLVCLLQPNTDSGRYEAKRHRRLLVSLSFSAVLHIVLMLGASSMYTVHSPLVISLLAFFLASAVIASPLNVLGLSSAFGCVKLSRASLFLCLVGMLWGGSRYVCSPTSDSHVLDVWRTLMMNQSVPVTLHTQLYLMQAEFRPPSRALLAQLIRSGVLPLFGISLTSLWRRSDLALYFFTSMTVLFLCMFRFLAFFGPIAVSCVPLGAFSPLLTWVLRVRGSSVALLTAVRFGIVLSLLSWTVVAVVTEGIPVNFCSKAQSLKSPSCGFVSEVLPSQQAKNVPVVHLCSYLRGLGHAALNKSLSFPVKSIVIAADLATSGTLALCLQDLQYSATSQLSAGSTFRVLSQPAAFLAPFLPAAPVQVFSFIGHPQYESAVARALSFRTLLPLYGVLPTNIAEQTLSALDADVVISSHQWCAGRSTNGQTFTSIVDDAIADLQAPELRSALGVSLPDDPSPSIGFDIAAGLMVPIRRSDSTRHGFSISSPLLSDDQPTRLCDLPLKTSSIALRRYFPIGIVMGFRVFGNLLALPRSPMLEMIFSELYNRPQPWDVLTVLMSSHTIVSDPWLCENMLSLPLFGLQLPSLYNVFFAKRPYLTSSCALRIAKILESQGQNNNYYAEIYYRRSIRLDDSNAEARHDFAVFLDENALNATEADEMYRSAIALRPQTSLFRGDYAYFLLLHGHRSASLREFEFASRMENADAHSLCAYSVALHHEDRDRSKALMQRAFALDPKDGCVGDHKDGVL